MGKWSDTFTQKTPGASQAFEKCKKIARINTYPRSLNYGGAVDFFFFDSL